MVAQFLYPDGFYSTVGQLHRDQRGQGYLPGALLLVAGFLLILYGLFLASAVGNKALFIGVGLILLGVGEVVTLTGRFWQVSLPAGLVLAIVGLLFLAGII